MKILVTGGSGLVGRALQNTKFFYDNHTFIFISSTDCDLTNLSKTQDLFQNVRPDFVIHLAAYV